MDPSKLRLDPPSETEASKHDPTLGASANTPAPTSKAAPKLGQWTLNKNTLKKLGIESSVLNALTKMKVAKSSGNLTKQQFISFHHTFRLNLINNKFLIM